MQALRRWVIKMETLPDLWIVALAFLVAGLIKGATSVGLTVAAIAMLSFFTTPRIIFLTAFIPVITINFMQVYRAGDMVGAMRRYLPFIICMVLAMPPALFIAGETPERILLGGLGAVVMVFALFKLTGWIPHVADRHDLVAQIVLGLLAGGLAGLTSVWLPAVFIYLTARSSSKEEFIRASGLLLFAGGIPLFTGYALEGLLGLHLALLSAALLIPTVIGMLIGERLRHHLSEEEFRKMVLIVFLVIGFDMVRRAFF